MQFVGKMLLYFWEKLACESIPKPKLQQVGQKLKRLFIGQTCSEQNLNCRTLRNSNMPPLAASEAKSLTVGKRQGHRPAFHQNNPNILVKIETDSSMSPVNVLEGNFGLTRPLINWPVLSLESLQVAATRSDLFVLRPVQLLPRWLAGSLKLEHRTRHQMHEKGASGKMMDHVSCKINEIVLNMLCLLSL